MLALVALLEVGYSGPLVQRPGRCDVQMVNVKGPTNALLNDMVGASTEISDKIWDPFDLAGSADQANLNLLRAAELKHSRVAMLACVGWAWTSTGTHFEGMLSPSAGVSFADATAAGALGAVAKVPVAGWLQMLGVIGFQEVRAPPARRCGCCPPPPPMPPPLPPPPPPPPPRSPPPHSRLTPLPLPLRAQLYWEKKFPSYECAGDYGVPKMTKDPTKLKELELMELKNGRLAMIGIISFACAEAIPGSVPFYPF